MRRVHPDLALVVLVLVVTAPVVQVLMAHQASRLAFTAAVVDHQTVIIDRYEDILSVDFAQRDGHLYSDKAPGQPLLAAPAYAVGRVVGLEAGAVNRPFHNLTLWWTSLWSSAIPLAALAVLIRRSVADILGSPRAAMASAAAVSLGTMLLAFGTVLFGHVLAALLSYACWVLARDRDVSPARLASAGIAGGLAVLTEYTAGIVVVVVATLVVVRHRGRALAFVAGGVPVAGILLLYNAIAWGDPLLFSYDFSGGFGDFHEQGFFGITLPDPVLLRGILVGERGLLTLTPVVGVGVVGLVDLALDRRHRVDGLVGLVVLLAFVALQGGWFSVTAGASPGPRYVVAALPFVALGVARMWERIPWLVVATGLAGAFAMMVAVATNPLAQPTESFTLGHWLWRLASGRHGDLLWSRWVPDPFAHMAWVLLVVATAWWAWDRATAR